MGDNRNYLWTNSKIAYRDEYPVIENWIRPGSSVIDLGCGNGSLLRLLKEKKGIQGYGIELSESGVDICHASGLNVRRGRIDTELTDIRSDSFEYAVCNVTLQMTLNPEVTLKEMKRIAKRQIVSFPNFAFLLQRLELVFSGRMPRKLLYGYTWYNTGHIHQLSIKDFRECVAGIGLRCVDSYYFLGKYKLPQLCMPNLLATEAVYLLERT